MTTKSARLVVVCSAMLIGGLAATTGSRDELPVRSGFPASSAMLALPMVPCVCVFQSAARTRRNTPQRLGCPLKRRFAGLNSPLRVAV